MKDERDPVSPDEVVVRLIWADFYKPNAAAIIRDRAFLPRTDEEAGISVFRLACLQEPQDALAVMAPEKRGRYGLALIAVAELAALGLSVEPARIDKVPGHAVIPELNSNLAASDSKRCSELQSCLAKLAAMNLIPPAEPKT
jgi:hypothetical protein